jgi:hypothetical protein
MRESEMPTKPKTKPRAGKKILEAINEGLEEISASFGWESASASSVSEAVEKSKNEPAAVEKIAGADVMDAEEFDADQDFDDLYEETGSRDGWIDKEEVEIAVDAFISTLLFAGIIRKSKSGKLPSFEDIFERFFDEEDEIVELARSFEHNIQGYFDWISPEDMEAARDCFLEIRDLLLKRLGGANDAN